jgi:hypothetical protein
LTDNLNNNLFTKIVNQNTIQGRLVGTPPVLNGGGEWIYLGTATLDPAFDYKVTQTTAANTFTSMRAEGVLFDLQIPEPATVSLAAFGLLGVIAARRKLV